MSTPPPSTSLLVVMRYDDLMAWQRNLLLRAGDMSPEQVEQALRVTFASVDFIVVDDPRPAMRQFLSFGTPAIDPMTFSGSGLAMPIADGSSPDALALQMQAQGGVPDGEGGAAPPMREIPVKSCGMFPTTTYARK